ncbi:MAG: lytic transglycosylase domain-containing protein, partial [Myxococcota bacterium]
VVCPFDPRENILAGTRYLRQLFERLGSWPRALAGYHAGPGRVESDRIPAETRVYVRRVLGSWKRGRPRAPRF